MIRKQDDNKHGRNPGWSPIRERIEQILNNPKLSDAEKVTKVQLMIDNMPHASLEKELKELYDKKLLELSARAMKKILEGDGPL